MSIWLVFAVSLMPAGFVSHFCVQHILSPLSLSLLSLSLLSLSPLYLSLLSLPFPSVCLPRTIGWLLRLLVLLPAPNRIPYPPLPLPTVTLFIYPPPPSLYSSSILLPFLSFVCAEQMNLVSSLAVGAVQGGDV